MKRKVVMYLLTASMVLQSLGAAQPVLAEETASGGTLVESGEESLEESPETEEALAESEAEVTEESQDVVFSWGDGTLGNTPAAILGGGRLAETADGGVYFSEKDSGALQYQDSQGNVRTVASQEGTSLNVFADAVYYVVDSEVRMLQLSTGQISTLLSWNEAIDQLYVVDESGLYFLAGGSLYGGTLGAEVSCIREDGSIAGFVPTREGMLYAKGSALHWDIWAGETLVASNVSHWDCEDGYLVLSIEGEDYQKSLSELFSGARSASQLETYQMGETHSVDELLNHDEECEVCAANGDLVAEGLMEVEEEPEPLEATSDVSAYASLSTGIQNIVKRAEQQYQIQWTPLEDIAGWREQYTFEAGTVYQGIPYGQPIYGQFVPFESDNSTPSVESLQEFLDAVRDPDSLMYTKVSTYTGIAPYYSSDCSSFVSYAWGLYRHTTSSLPGECTKVSNQSIYSVQVGDIFNKAGSHTVLVADIGYASDGTIEYIDILQQTPPKVKLTRYGVGGEETLATLHETYLGSGYTLYRFNGRNSVTYTHSCASPVEGDTCSQCASQLFFAENDVWIQEGESIRLSLTNTTGQSVTWKSMDTTVATVDSNGTVTGLNGSVEDAYGHTVNVVIQASAGGKTEVCTVHVTREEVDNTVEGFVKRLYRLVLGRVPRNDEVEFWADILKNHEMSGTEVAAGFVFSAEYQRKNVSNYQYVYTMYQTMMGRDPRDDEVAFWQNYLDAGFTRNFVYEGFANSTEFGRICGNYGIVQGSYSERSYVDNHEQVTFFVARLYQTCLGRNPRTDEAEDWVRRLVEGSSGGREVAYGFFFSAEFQRQNHSNTQYVRLLYQAFMDRVPTNAEAQDWVDRLNNGASRTFVFDGFAYSAEFRRICNAYGIEV